MKKTVKFASCIVAILITVGVLLYAFLIAFVIAPPVVPWVEYLFYKAPSKPEIQHGEFPFRIEYEYENKVFVIEDVVICDYAGTTMISNVGKYRKWNTTFKSGCSKIVLADVSEKQTVDDAGFEFLYLFLYCGDAMYYMENGIAGGYGSPNDGSKYIDCAKKNSDHVMEGTMISSEDAWEQFGIRIISAQFSQPIENTFGSK